MKRIQLLIYIVMFLPFLYGSSPAPTIVSFTFDDGYKSTYDKAFPIFKKSNYPASVAIYNKSFESGYMGNSKLKELQRNNWEIISHSLTHPRLNSLSWTKQRNEINNSYSTFKDKGFKITGFVTPYSECSQTCANITKYKYNYAFTVYKNSKTSSPKDLVITKGTNKYRLYRAALDQLTLKESKEIVDYVQKNRGWVSFYIHELDKPKYMSSRDLESLLDYIKKKKISVNTPSKAVDRIYGK
jgi:peptidoglycan/xylan/chitin deacetylase (PgdA/CDA1 family)